MPNKKIMLVDDSETILKIEEQMLKNSPYEVIKARNGYEAVVKAQVRLPDLIFMDVEMPEMDGITACAEINKHEETQHIPIILLTSLGDEGHIARGYMAGCKEYHTKPIKADVFLQTINHYLEEKTRPAT
jgi:CheY-like chemotaxis protein